MDATIRPAGAADAAIVAHVHNRSRAAAFRGHIPDEALDNAAVLEREWVAYFQDPDGRVAIAEVDGQPVGMAYAIPGQRTELRNLYLLAEAAGTGVAPRLMDAVIPPGQPAFLWVADFNERAQAFYRKHGFAFDGEETHHEGDNVTLKRMVRD